MSAIVHAKEAQGAVPLLPVSTQRLPELLATLDAGARRWVETTAFTAQPATWCGLPGPDGALSRVLVGMSEPHDVWALAHLPLQLPGGTYRLERTALPVDAARAALGFALGAYQFTLYKAAKREPAKLALPEGVDAQSLLPTIEACHFVRNLVNTPTEDMGPADLEDAARALGARFGAHVRAIVGDELLAQNFPAIHAVGRASHRPPRLIELEWGDASKPRLSIVGKGVCFDTGGLDLKPSDGMRWMKKDMGGAAHALALAVLVMGANLPVRLQLLLPAVENAIGPNSYRPGEVIRTRAGLTVEIDNTDAEGRVILCDALSYACERAPAFLLDFATLTGAARVALGPDLPALFANRDEDAGAFVAAGRSVQDPVWHMPLWQPYRALFESGIADFANAGASRQAGAITAALYLERFVPASVPWAHIDVYAWNDVDRPGRPRGGEAQSLRAAFANLQGRFGPGA